jgi:micrococcal nuclease
LAEILSFSRRRASAARAPLLALLALLAVAAAGYLAGGSPSGLAGTGSGAFRLCGRSGQPNCVVDGDTIRHHGVSIRLADIDAPEVRDPKCASEAALGNEATHRLLELMNAGPFEVMRGGARDEDMYGRKLRVIARGGRSVADTLVAEGLARRWDGARRSWCG